MRHFNTRVFRAILVAVLCTFIGDLSPVYADAVATVGNCGAGTVKVRTKKKYKNTTGKTANDFHLYMFQNDRKGIEVLGAKVNTTGAFTSAAVVMGTDNNKDVPPPPGNHGARVDLTGGSVAAGAFFKVTLTLCMNERNCLKIKDVEWSFPDPVNNPPKPPPNQPKKKGWRAQRPHPGGAGGNPGDPTGGGQGAQEGNGGAGNFIHNICIENEDNVPMLLDMLKLLISTTLYTDPDTDINWSLIAPIQNSAVPPEPPVTIPAHGIWCYAFETTGAYIGGHIYLDYTLSVVPPSVAAGVVDPGLETFGDHPVDALCGDPGCATSPPPPLGSCSNLETGECISDLYEYDCNVPGEIWTEAGSCTIIPTVSEWGLVVMTLLLMVVATVVLARRRGGATQVA